MKVHPLFHDKILIILFLLVLVSNAAYLHRVPGLLGDEASEGENVYEYLDKSELITVTGERSYIGPAIDYIRVPFITLFNYGTLALRLPMLIITLITFWLAAKLFDQLFGTPASYYALTALFFSPVYLTYQRLGWAITMFPFFAILLTYLLTKKPNSPWPLLAGLTAGLALHNHIIFLATLVAITVTWFISQIKNPKQLAKHWPALIGFAAGFGTQLAVLNLWTEDQGNSAQAASLFSERLADLPQLLPLVISGSSFIARYTGIEFSTLTSSIISGIIVTLALVAIIFHKKRIAVLLWSAGTVIQILALLYTIDRFSLRYFVVPVLALWVLAGLGVGVVAGVAHKKIPNIHKYAPSFLAISLAATSFFIILVPFLQTGGSLADFSLGNRTNSAEALVDTRELVSCLEKIDAVYSKNVHIFNRIQYLSHQYSGIKLAPSSEDANWLVHYNDIEDVTTTKEPCPELKHFTLEQL